MCDGVVVIARCDAQHCDDVLGVFLPKLGVCVVVSVPSIQFFTLKNTCPRFNASNNPSLRQIAKMQFATMQHATSRRRQLYLQEREEAKWEEYVKPRERWELRVCKPQTGEARGQLPIS